MTQWFTKIENKVFLFTVLLATLFLTSCSKDEGKNSFEGAFTLDVQVFHHTVPVPFAEVYLFEDTTIFPGKDTSNYHFSAKTDEMGKAVISGVLPGNHWLLGLGFDGVDSVFGNKPIFVDPKDQDGVIKVIFLISE